MTQSSLLGLVLPEAMARLQEQGLKVEIQVTGDNNDPESPARVVRVIKKEDYYLLTVVYPPRLRLES